MAESSVERGRRLKRKRKRKHLLQESSVERVTQRLKQKHVVKRGTPLKSDLTYKKLIRFVADRKKQIRAKMAARRKNRFGTVETCAYEYGVIDPPAIIVNGVYNPPTFFTPLGGIYPLDIDGRDSGRLTGYCITALKAFNKHNHQDPKFDFDGLVRAKKQDDASPTIFQASVKKNFNGSIKVRSCAIQKSRAIKKD
ncbi:uncharacterized protein LOC131600415 isoform X2 [Vicia villosa]|uniref:uncharacterized protein LOC131600415 isoform X2 n=1 Tax=Vicia villosa TaxID=3911 RepID=UPI00273ABD2E|nr:uncharacterized protein LOC131600415 isoform X2 [Vicia villosa]